MCCPCETLVEDDAEELHRLLELDHDVIDLQDDICRDVFASSEVDGDRLVDRELEALFFEEFCRLRWVPLDVSGQGRQVRFRLLIRAVVRRLTSLTIH